MKKLYLTQWEYNGRLIMEELKKLVLANGGYLVSTWEKKTEKTKIYNRTLLNKIRAKEQYINDIDDWLQKGIGKKEFLENKKIETPKELETLKKQYKKATRIVTNNGYLAFILNNDNLKSEINTNDLYYIRFDDNPFFDFYYYKQVTDKNLKVNYNCYIDKLPKQELFVKDYYDKYTKKNIQDTAKNIFDYLINAHYSKRESTKTIFKQYKKISD